MGDRFSKIRQDNQLQINQKLSTMEGGFELRSFPSGLILNIALLSTKWSTLCRARIYMGVHKVEEEVGGETPVAVS